MPAEKGPWEKADILLKPVGGLLTALAVALVGILGSTYLEEQRVADSNVKLYAQLMSSREAADSALRQQMFNSMIKTFLGEGLDSAGTTPNDPGNLVLALELLAYNFHDALDLAPLFKHVARVVAAPAAPAGDDSNTAPLEQYRGRLERVAREITGKQLAALEDAGEIRDLDVFLDEEFPARGIGLLDEVLQLQTEVASDSVSVWPQWWGVDSTPREEELARRFVVEVLELDRKRREVKVRLESYPEGEDDPEVSLPFWVGFFDFPMIDNTRLSGGRRCAVVMTRWESEVVELAFVYFPGSRASLKEKPYYDEVVEQLKL